MTIWKYLSLMLSNVLLRTHYNSWGDKVHTVNLSRDEAIEFAIAVEMVGKTYLRSSDNQTLQEIKEHMSDKKWRSMCFFHSGHYTTIESGRTEETDFVSLWIHNAKSVKWSLVLHCFLGRIWKPYKDRQQKLISALSTFSFDRKRDDAVFDLYMFLLERAETISDKEIVFEKMSKNKRSLAVPRNYSRFIIRIVD